MSFMFLLSKFSVIPLTALRRSLDNPPSLLQIKE
jgi:hypothetical protein